MQSVLIKSDHFPPDEAIVHSWEVLIDSCLEYLESHTPLFLEVDGLPNSSFFRFWINNSFVGLYHRRDDGLWYVRSTSLVHGKRMISEKACQLYLVRKYLNEKAGGDRGL